MQGETQSMLESEKIEGPSTRTREEHNAVAAMTSPWIEKYRPETLKDLIAHQDIVETGKSCIHFFDPSPHLFAQSSLRPVNKFVDQNRLPHLLLYGPPGTGKTSTVLALAKRIFGPKYKVRQP